MGLIDKVKRLSWPCISAGTTLMAGALLLPPIKSENFFASPFSSMNDIFKSSEVLMTTGVLGIGLFTLLIGISGLAVAMLEKWKRRATDNTVHGRCDDTEGNWMFL